MNKNSSAKTNSNPPPAGKLEEVRLIAITRESIAANEHDTITALFEAGLMLLHLRKPDCTGEDISNLLLRIPDEYHSRIVLHDYFQLANTFNVRGIHLNRRNPVPAEKPGLTISKSCHSVEEVKRAGNIYDYVFLSPVFDSISKTGYRRAFTTAELVKAKEEHIINKRVIALGGITVDNIPLVKSFGFGGFAVLGSLWGKESSQTKDVLKRFEILKKNI